MPRLDGKLLVDLDSRVKAADDFGHIVNHLPVAVLQPGSVDDIQSIVEYANRHGLKVGVRGAGHSTFGQAQVEAGVVIDMSTLAAVNEVKRDAITVDAGARFFDVILPALPAGVTLPVLPDSLDHTVGGVLAVGGLGASAHRFGLVADNVLEIEVVTGTAERVRCSPTRRADLFDAALGGLGQFAIITQATLALVPVKPRIRTYAVMYEKLANLLAVHRALALESRFDELQSQIVTTPERGWLFILQASAYFPIGSPPDDRAMLQGLTESALDVSIQDRGELAWVTQSVGTTQFLKSASLWDVPHPRLDLLLPDDSAETLLQELLEELDPTEMGSLPINLIAMPTDKTRRSLVGLPDADVCFALTVHRFAPAEKAAVEAMLSSNRALFERARELGAKRYATSAIPFTKDDWVDHFGSAYFSLLQRKQSFDPRAVLAPAYGIFSRG